MKRWATVAVGALLILWVPFLYWQLQHDEPPPAPAAAPVEPAEPTPELAPPVPGPDPVPAEPAPAAPGAPAAPAAPAQPAPAPPAQPAPPAPGAPDQAEMDPAWKNNIPVPSGGPFEELKARYEKSRRDPEASKVEADVRAQFGKDEVPADMLRSLSCHEDVCKVELLWSQARVLAFMRLSMVWAQTYSTEMAVTPGVQQADGLTPLEMYFGRKQPEFKRPD